MVSRDRRRVGWEDLRYVRLWDRRELVGQSEGIGDEATGMSDDGATDDNIRGTHAIIELRNAAIGNGKARKQNEVDERVDMALFREIQRQTTFLVVPGTLEVVHYAAEQR